jgi:hypothetical protein
VMSEQTTPVAEKLREIHRLADAGLVWHQRGVEPDPRTRIRTLAREALDALAAETEPTSCVGSGTWPGELPPGLAVVRRCPVAEDTPTRAALLARLHELETTCIHMSESESDQSQMKAWHERAECAFRARAALAATPEAASQGEAERRAGEWQPIETAPKMRKILVFYRNALGKARTVLACRAWPVLERSPDARRRTDLRAAPTGQAGAVTQGTQRERTGDERSATSDYVLHGAQLGLVIGGRVPVLEGEAAKDRGAVTPAREAVIERLRHLVRHHVGPCRNPELCRYHLEHNGPAMTCPVCAAEHYLNQISQPSAGEAGRLREAVADLCHEQWTGWMRYLFSRCEITREGALIPAMWVARWQRQMDTPYAKLSQHEQDSDRKEADRFLAALAATPEAASQGEAERRAGEWQPIETAPADKIVFLAVDTGEPFGWTLGTGYLTAMGWVTRGIGEVVADGLGLAHPTHWMPLPSPPGAKP